MSSAGKQKKKRKPFFSPFFRANCAETKTMAKGCRKKKLFDEDADWMPSKGRAFALKKNTKAKVKEFDNLIRRR